MGYLSIENLYRRNYLFECYALEKIDGTSAHILYKNDDISTFGGCVKPSQFEALFDKEALLAKFRERFKTDDEVYVHGEAYGGKIQGMSHTYGPDLRFTAFDVKGNGRFWSVVGAEEFVKYLGLDFVPYERGPLTKEWLDEQRDRPSRVAIYPDKIAEGIVVRPIHEYQDANGGRIWIAKHKRPEFSEHKKPREITQDELQVVSDANLIADDWVTERRLDHVLQKNPFSSSHDIGNVLKAMVDDVKKESDGEIVWSKEVNKAINRKTVELLKTREFNAN